MNILLIKPCIGPYVNSSTPFVPLGLTYVAGALEKAGHSVQILDLGINNLTKRELTSYLSTSKPDVIAMTCMITQFNTTIEVATISKQVLPTTCIVVGGPLPTSIPKIFLNQPTIDIIVIGEGEETIVELINKLEKGETLNGVTGTAYLQSGKQHFNPPRELISDLDALPFPARHLLTMDRYFCSNEFWFGENIYVKATNMISSRGCPYNCIYCDRAATGSKWRKRSAINVVDEMQWLVEKYKINGILFNDDMFDFDKKRVFQICDEIEERGLDVFWGVNSRVNHANEEVYKKMHRSGCIFVAYGLESGNQSMLNFMRKGITLQQVARSVDMARRTGLRAIGYFMIGMLGETKAMVEQTIQFAKGLNLDSAGFSELVPIPGTDLFDLAKKQYLISDDDFVASDQFGGTINLTQDLTPKGINRLRKKAEWEFYWSRRLRTLPRFCCSIVNSSFPVVYATLGIKPNVLPRLSKKMNTLRLPLS